MTMKLKAGDKVTIHHWDYKGNADVVVVEDRLIGVSTDLKNKYDHDCDGLAKACGHGLWIPYDPAYFTLIKAAKAPKRPVFKPGSQNGMLLSHLLEGMTITRIQADHLYRIASLTRRIKDLKEAGHKIVAKVKVDPTGRAYTEYALRNAGRV